MSVDAKIMALGRRIRDVRISMSLNQKDFAKIGAVGITTQQQYEAGKTSPTAAYLFQLEAAGVDIGYLVTGHRQDGTIDPKADHLAQLFDLLTEREQEGIMAMLLVLSGRTSSAISPLRSHAIGSEFGDEF